MPGPDSPPPSYRESVLIANLQVSFTANNAAPAARNVGDICHMEQDLSPERQDRQVEDSDEQDSCEHIDLDKWSRWPFERWGQWYMYVLMVIIGFAGAASMATTHLHGRGRRWSGSSDQRSRDQEIPMFTTRAIPVPQSPPPSYREAMRTANLQVLVTDNDLTPCARNVGDFHQLERDLSPERQDGQVENSDEQDVLTDSQATPSGSAGAVVIAASVTTYSFTLSDIDSSQNGSSSRSIVAQHKRPEWPIVCSGFTCVT
ncbi:hypothetical protein HPB52_020444 [Rhipicephalus sanguineus]|uniref:Uncharacterized protein n=1 Tax=Rhipicephalus sanguineus TaxID=34632 RepID=A0A9D4TBL9_RHISA|nr:hypothetical protein HPB52_020444 [Rhipicephalus sanguineus]